MTSFFNQMISQIEQSIFKYQFLEFMNNPFPDPVLGKTDCASDFGSAPTFAL